MATLSRDDLTQVFVLLALAYLFDSIPSGFLWPLGLIGFLLLLGALWVSDNDYGEPFREFIKNIDPEIVLRIAIVVTFLGILLLISYVVLIGLLIGTLLLFLPGDVFSVNFFRLEMTAKSFSKSK